MIDLQRADLIASEARNLRLACLAQANEACRATGYEPAKVLETAQKFYEWVDKGLVIVTIVTGTGGGPA